jgi:peptidoglycan/xylan/chitin deacetylase (PgdA/CDA1 family)
MILKSVARAMSPAGEQARLTILIFHRVVSQPDPLFPGEPDVHRFNDIVHWVSHWFKVLPLDKAVLQLQNAQLPPRAAAITFDDGYADNVSNAMPVLQRHGVPATFFVATAFLHGGRMWNDAVIEAIVPLETIHHKRCAIDSVLAHIKYDPPDVRQKAVDSIVDLAGAGTPHDLMMRPSQLLQLRNAGMQIGAHTATHPILEKSTDLEAMHEIAGSKAALESWLGEPVRLFAYPNGKPDVDYSARHVAMVRNAGFVGAVSTAVGAARCSADPYQLPRFTPWDQSRWRYGWRLLSNLRRTGSVAAPLPS